MHQAATVPPAVRLANHQATSRSPAPKRIERHWSIVSDSPKARTAAASTRCIPGVVALS